MVKNRGGSNIDYAVGFEIEDKLFAKYKGMIINILTATNIEQTTRGLVDKATGTDAVALIEGNVYGISLRFRSGDFNSFTLNRHIDDSYCEINKWIKNRSNQIKPAYYVQISETNEYYRLIRVNIDAYSLHLQYLIKHNLLEPLYNKHLKAYEFKLNANEKVNGVFSTIIKKV